ncbi:MAG: energy-coupling factor transporter ATPase [Bacillota bacterium]
MMDRTNNVLIRIKDLTHTYNPGEANQREGLRGVTADIYSGEFLAVIGANGSGKSTLARHLNALLLPGSGSVTVDGLDTSRDEHLWDIRRRVGMVFQNPDNQLVAALVEEDVVFGPENLGLDPAEIRRRVDRALAWMGLEELRHRAPHLLSGGQKQRLAVAGVLVMQPDCLVLDEPTAMLDPSGRKELMATIKRLCREEGVTVVLITHFMEEAVAADRIWIMHQGAIALEGTPREIFQQGSRLAAYNLELPGPAELAERLKRSGLELPPGILTVEELVQGLCP